MKFIEHLESRRLFSVTFTPNPAAPAERADIAIDSATLDVAQAKLNVDYVVDRLAFAGSSARTNTTLEPLFNKFGTDLAAARLTLRTDALSEYSQYLTDDAVVVTDTTALINAVGATAINAAEVNLVDAQITMQQHLVTNIDKRVTDRQTITATLHTDEQSIITALPSTGLSSTTQAQVTKWLNDFNIDLIAVTTDLQKVGSDRTALIADLNSELS